jgi:hypothetical protein
MRFLSRGAIAWCSLVLTPATAFADPVGWAQPGGKGTDVVITYSFSNLLDGGFNTQLSPTELREATAAAFALWSRYVPLHFFEVPDSGPVVGEGEYPGAGNPDIRIGYFPELFDGAVAHAHLPYSTDSHRSGLAGDVHFSNDVSPFHAPSWGNAPDGAVDFFSAMLHEAGHALGLHHAADADAVMGTVFLVFSDRAAADLRPSDIAAIRALYGAGVGSVQMLDSDSLGTPEPGTLVLIATGLAIGLRRRLRRAIANCQLLMTWQPAAASGGTIRTPGARIVRSGAQSSSPLD